MVRRKNRNEAETWRIQQEQLALQNKHEQQLPGLVGETTGRSERLQGVLSTDDQIIALREEVLSSSKVAMDNGTMTAADYARDANAVLQAKLEKATHEVQLQQAILTYQHTLGNHRSHEKYLILFVPFFIACNSEEKAFDATGTFEAREVIVSAEQTGKLTDYAVDEGQMLEANACGRDRPGPIGAEKPSWKPRSGGTEQTTRCADAACVLQEQIKTANFELEQTRELVKGGAATQKQLDDANWDRCAGKKKKKTTGCTTLSTADHDQQHTIVGHHSACRSNRSMTRSTNVMVNPINGTIVRHLLEGRDRRGRKPLPHHVIWSHMELRAYVTGDQLATCPSDRR